VAVKREQPFQFVGVFNNLSKWLQLGLGVFEAKLSALPCSFSTSSAQVRLIGTAIFATATGSIPKKQTM